MERVDATALGLLVHGIYPDATLVRSWPLTGGISAQVTAVELLFPDSNTKRLIVCQHGPSDLRRNPNIAADEFRLLQALHSAGLPVPRPHYVDQSCELFATPCIVVEYIEGAADLSPADPMAFATQFATQLARIHSLDVSSLTFLPRKEERVVRWIADQPTEPDERLSERRIRAVLQGAWPLRHPNKLTLLHGDYWPGNVLWKDGQLVGVIDWEDAALGDPLSDLSSSRLEILWTCGADAMQRFTEDYRSQTNFDLTNLPFWDLYTAVRSVATISGWGLDEAVERRMREQYHLFISRAFELLKGI